MVKDTITKTHLWIIGGVISIVVTVAAYAESRIGSVSCNIIERVENKFVTKDAFHSMGIQLQETTTLMASSKESIGEMKKQLELISQRLVSLEKLVTTIELRTR